MAAEFVDPPSLLAVAKSKSGEARAADHADKSAAGLLPGHRRGITIIVNGKGRSPELVAVVGIDGEEVRVVTELNKND